MWSWESRSIAPQEEMIPVKTPARVNGLRFRLRGGRCLRREQERHRRLTISSTIVLVRLPEREQTLHYSDWPGLSRMGPPPTQVASSSIIDKMNPAINSARPWGIPPVSLLGHNSASIQTQCSQGIRGRRHKKPAELRHGENLVVRQSNLREVYHCPFLPSG